MEFGSYGPSQAFPGCFGDNSSLIPKGVAFHKNATSGLIWQAPRLFYHILMSPPASFSLKIDVDGYRRWLFPS